MSTDELETVPATVTPAPAGGEGGGLLRGVEPEFSLCTPMPDWLLEERVRDVMLFVEELIRQQP
jgi:hypothetical protein